MPITDLPGLPDLVAAILLVIFDVAVVMAPEIWLVAVLFSGNLPTLAACCKTYAGPAAARYRTIRTPPGRCGDRGPERDRDPRPGAARLSSPNPAAAGASKPC